MLGKCPNLLGEKSSTGGEPFTSGWTSKAGGAELESSTTLAKGEGLGLEGGSCEDDRTIGTEAE